jgi:hypothetical protein
MTNLNLNSLKHQSRQSAIAPSLKDIENRGVSAVLDDVRAAGMETSWTPTTTNALA